MSKGLGELVGELEEALGERKRLKRRVRRGRCVLWGGLGMMWGATLLAALSGAVGVTLAMTAMNVALMVRVMR